MSDQRRLDDLMHLAFHDARTVEPTETEIMEAVRAAHVRAPVRLRGRRFVVAFVATLILLTGTALAVPPSRDALFDGFGAFKSFFTGGGDPPGTPIPGGENDENLTWFRGSDTTNGAVIAQAQSVRLVAYRQTTTGFACIAYGGSASVCRPDQEWAELLAASPIQTTGPVPEPDAVGRLPLFGITADNVTAIELRYADGTTEHVDDVQHGFVLFADPRRRPTTLTARDRDGHTLVTQDITDLQWEFHG